MNSHVLGLVPAVEKAAQGASSTFNARAETLIERPNVRGSSNIVAVSSRHPASMNGRE